MKVVVCDDQPMVLDAICGILTSKGLNCVSESSSLRIIPTLLKEKPDCLLLDLWMPNMSGDLVIKTLRQHPELSKLRVIMISGSASGGKIARESGADAFLQKPFDIGALVAAVTRN